MPDSLNPTQVLTIIMVANGLLAIPFGLLANHSFSTRGRLSSTLAVWSGIAMHGHALMTFAVAWLDRGSLYAPQWLSVLPGCAAIALGAYVIWLGRKAYGDQARVYGLKEDELVISGIYRRSRNPQYFGYGLMFLGAAMASGSGLSFVFVCVFAAMVHAGITLVEEPHLERVFGSSYVEYRNQVRRYFG